MKTIPLSKGKEAIVDDADYERLILWKWHLSINGYAVHSIYTPKGVRKVFMHRIILDAPPELQVDHKDGNRLDNQRGNLRLCNQSQNFANTRANRLNKSGLKGVDYEPRSGKWRRQIVLDGVKTWLGLHSDPLNAALAYDVAALQQHGQFARLNVMDEKFWRETMKRIDEFVDQPLPMLSKN